MTLANKPVFIEFKRGGRRHAFVAEQWRAVLFQSYHMRGPGVQAVPPVKDISIIEVDGELLAAALRAV